MRFWVITLFPELITAWIQVGLLAKARQSGLLQVDCLSPRDFARDRHRSVDDAPFGGGPGMIMMPGPLAEAMDAADKAASQTAALHRILLTPQGVVLRQQDVRRWAQMPAVMLVCGRYEGVDERARVLVDEEVSLGDFVMQGGEVAAVAIIEAVARLIPGVLGNLDSSLEESHASGLLEYPQYTRPRVFRGREVPPVLLSGNHAQIARWRRLQSLRRTRERRPDLFAGLELSPGERDELDRTDAAEGTEDE